MGQIFKNIIAWLTDTKNTRLILFIGVIIFALLFLYQCNATSNAKAEVEKQKQETVRIENNYEASRDSLEQFQLDENTWRAEKQGYVLKLDELKEDYNDLLGDFEIERNKKPKTIIKTEYEIREIVDSIPVFVITDSLGNKKLQYSDSTNFDSLNYRYFSSDIPFSVKFDSIDSTYSIVPHSASLNMSLGMNLNLGLFQDKDTKKVSIVADTDYPGVTFTNLEGAYIMDDPDNKKVLRSFRKNMSIGISLGYGIMYDMNNNNFANGPYVGIGFNWQPKFLQW